MINANELRVNNLVYTDTNSIVPIRAAGILAIEQGKLTVFPIPLTPEILEQCEFVKVKSPWHIEGYQLLVDSLNEDYFRLGYNNGKYFYLTTGIDWHHIEPSKPIEFLHHLQNVYFDFTYRELTINTKA